jgi:hypothetical protein
LDLRHPTLAVYFRLGLTGSYLHLHKNSTFAGCQDDVHDPVAEALLRLSRGTFEAPQNPPVANNMADENPPKNLVFVYEVDENFRRKILQALFGRILAV